MIDIGNNAPSCADYVIAQLAEKGVSSDKITWRTNFNLGDYGNICSFSIKGDRTPVFGIPGVQLTAVQKVVPIRPKIKAKVDVATNEAIHRLTGVQDARDKLGLTGKGIRVAVVDSGVDYTHPALGGGFGKGYTVSYGYDLVGDSYDGTDSSTQPDDDPLDNCSSSSHGTHVAGIIAGDTSRVTDSKVLPVVNFTGTAPGVEIGAYRIFGCGEDASGTDIIVAAIYKAAHDGSHIINLSIGGGPTYSESASAVACEKVGRMGHYCVAASGNDGDAGEFTAGDPGVSLGGFGIGSADNSEIIQTFMSVDGENYAVQFGTARKEPFPSSFDLAGIVVSNKNAETENIQNDGVEIPEDVAGKIVLVRWGPSEQGGSKTRCDTVHEKGGIACILYGYNDDMSTGIFGSEFIPSAIIAREAGLRIRAAIEAGKKVNAVIYPEQTSKINGPTGGTLSGFSSHGLDLDLFIKPDITAIGGNVYSTVSRHAANGSIPYSSYSGTSMATPNFAGILALYLEHQSKISSGADFESVKARFQNTASPMKIYKSEDYDSVAGQGAGLVNIYKALTTESRVTPGSLSLNDTIRMRKSYTIQVHNDAKDAADYSLSNLGANMISPFAAGDDAVQVRTNTLSSPVFANVKFSETAFKLQPYESKEIQVEITAPATKDRWPIFSGYLVVTSSRDEIIHVPYAGVKGDWNEAPVFVRDSEVMNHAVGNIITTGLFDDQNQLATKINLTSGALILPIMATNTRNAAIDVVPVEVDESKILALNLDPKNLPSPFLYDITGNPIGLFTGQAARNTAGDFQSVFKPSPYAWYGEVGYNGTLLPAGKYKMRFYGLKHFGQTSTSGDIDTTDASQFDVLNAKLRLLTKMLKFSIILMTHSLKL